MCDLDPWCEEVELNFSEKKTIKEAIKTRYHSKRYRWTGTFLTLVTVAKAVGFTFNPWIGVGVYIAGTLVTKEMDMRKQKNG